MYRGAPNADVFAPGDHCYIDAQTFRDPRELAEYLRRLTRDDLEYGSYLAWKSKPLRQEFLDKVERFRQGPFGRLCTLLRAPGGIADLQRDPVHHVVLWLNRRLA